MTYPDYRALCAELAEQLDNALNFTISSDTRRHMKALTARARTAMDSTSPPNSTTPSSMSPNREPLLHVMDNASAALLDATMGKATARECWAAEILALRDHILPDEPPPQQSDMAFPEWNLRMEVYEDRQRLRNLLTAEAERAEGGEQ